MVTVPVGVKLSPPFAVDVQITSAPGAPLIEMSTIFPGVAGKKVRKCFAPANWILIWVTPVKLEFKATI